MPLNAAAIAAAKLEAGVREDQKDLVGVVLGNVASNFRAAVVADLNQDISATYVEAEVQAISDKVDALLAALRAAGLLASS